MVVGEALIVMPPPPVPVAVFLMKEQQLPVYVGHQKKRENIT